MKRLLVPFILLFTVFFTYTVVAQEMGSLRKAYELSIPEKIHKLVLDPLPAGTYSVGSGGYFSTIQSAFDKLSTDGIAGEVILELIDNLYTAPTDSFGFKLIGPIPGAGQNSRVIIKPTVNENVILEGNGFRVMTFINTSYLTLDGVSLNGATTLKFHALYNASFSWNDCVNLLYNSDHNIVKNITFISEDYFRYGASLWLISSSTEAPDSNLILNNFIKKGGAPYIGSDFASSRPEGNVIRGNAIGSETDSLINWGIQVSTCKNSIIENNIVQNLKIMNTVGEQLILGINSYSGLGDIIRNNVVHNIKAPSGYTGVGILLSGGSGSNNMVYNNMVYDIQSASTQSNSRVAGIQIWLQNNPKIYYNTVYLSGTGTNPAGSAAFYIYGYWGNSTNVEVKNNVLVNTRDESPYVASTIYDYTASNLTSDYNDLYYDDTNQNTCLVRIGTTKYNTLADWQTTGKDLHSLNQSVNFVSSSDLHINTNYNTLLDGHAIPIAVINTDFDGDTRNGTTPDIGADEFDIDPNATVWQTQNSNYPANVLVVNISSVDNQVCWAVGQIYPGNTTPYAGYIRTIDGGNNWICDTIQGVTNSYFQQVFAIDKDTAYITAYKLLGTSGTQGIYKTTDGGASWIRQEAYNSSQSGPGIMHFFDSQNGVVIGDPNLEAYTTTNGGLTWNPVTMPSALSGEYTWIGNSRLTSVGDVVWFGTNRRLFKSTDKGYTWTVLLNETQYYGWAASIAFQDSQIGIHALRMSGNSTDHIVRKTTDGGTTWNTLSNSVLDYIAPSCIQHIPGTISTYLITGGRATLMRGTAVSYDAGESWTLIDTVGCYTFSFPSDIVGWGSQFAKNVIYKYVGPRLTTVEEEVINLVPTGYSLSQNYPNPFNPSTTIRYTVPKLSKVVIKVYDILGNEIAILMDGEKQVGTYELTWNATNLPSGVYFYHLKAGSFIETKKMVLLR